MSTTSSIDVLEEYISEEHQQTGQALQSQGDQINSDLDKIRSAMASISVTSDADYASLLAPPDPPSPLPEPDSTRWRGISSAGAPSFQLPEEPRFNHAYEPPDNRPDYQPQPDNQPASAYDTSPQTSYSSTYQHPVPSPYDDMTSTYDLSDSLTHSHAPPSGAAPRSNKAVLSSLRALQDKIRKIEAERAAALQQCSELSELHNSTQVDSSSVREAEARAGAAARNKQRIAYERMASEKNAMEVKVTKVVEKLAAADQQMKDAQLKTDEVRAARDQAAMAIEQANSAIEALEKEVAGIQAAEQRLAKMISEQQSSGRQLELALAAEIEDLEAELRRGSLEQAEVVNRKEKMDQFLNVVMTLNQELVETSASPTKVRRESPVRHKEGKNKNYYVGGEEGEGVIYRANVGVAASLLLDGTGRKSGVGIKEELQKVYDVLLEDGGGHDAHSANSVHSAPQLSDVVHSVEHSEQPTLTAPNANKFNVAAATASMASSPGGEWRERGEAMTKALIERAVTPPRSSARGEHKPGFAEGVDDLREASGMIEQEFADLNEQYASMCAMAKQGGGEEDIGALLDVISNLQNKGEQLKLMKKTMNNKSLRMPVFSPDAMKRKAAALSILREYREQAVEH